MNTVVHGVNATANGDANDRARGPMVGERPTSCAMTLPASCTTPHTDEPQATTIKPTVAITRPSVATARTHVATSNRRDANASDLMRCSTSHTSSVDCAPQVTWVPPMTRSMAPMRSTSALDRLAPLVSLMAGTLRANRTLSVVGGGHLAPGGSGTAGEASQRSSDAKRWVSVTEGG